MWSIRFGTCFFACFWVLLWRPSSFLAAIAGAGVLLIAALSDGGVILFLPLWALRVLAVEDRRDAVIVGAFAMGLGIQLSMSWSVIKYLGEPGAPLYRVAPQWHWGLIPAYLQRVVGGVTGERTTGYLWVHLGVPLELVLGAALVTLVMVALVGGNGRTRAVVPVMVAASLGIFLFSGYQRWTTAGYKFLWPGGTWWSSGSHYTILPTLLLLSALLVELDSRPLILSAALWNRTRAITAAILVAAVVVSFDVGDPSSRGNATWLRAVDQGRAECLRSSYDTTLVLIESGFVATSMEVPCRRLIGARGSLTQVAPPMCWPPRTMPCYRVPPCSEHT